VGKDLDAINLMTARRHQVLQGGEDEYREVPGHSLGNWQIEIAVWNLASSLQCASETCWRRFGQFLNDVLNEFLNDFLYENLNFLYENLGFSL